LPNWIEFHDSTLMAIRRSPDSGEIELVAYVHRWELLGNQWRGTGWEQPVRMTMRNAVGPSVVLALPTDISDGRLRANGLTSEDLVPLPFESPGDFALMLQLVDGSMINITGRGLRVEGLGDARFVENLPEDMKPHAG
jgi:hypothetical protein